MKKIKIINRLFYIIFLISIITVIPACNDNDEGADNSGDGDIVGGPCEYNEIIGTAVITSIVDADPGNYNCDNDPVEVIFNFTPDNPDAGDGYRFPDTSDTNQTLTIGGGMNPPEEYMTIKGITAGSSHACIRKEITSGTCTPVIFEFSAIDLTDYAEYCW